GDGPRARRAGWHALGLGVGFMLLAAVCFLLWPGPLVALYTRDPEVMRQGATLLALAAAFQAFDGIQTVTTGALRGLGETRAPMVANLVGYWLFGLPLGLFLCFTMRKGILGLWVGLTVALISIALTLLARWRRDSARIALICPATR
ncbi:MAG: MATE family efflux transporter, partial [Terracidiphilus sp.]